MPKNKNEPTVEELVDSLPDKFIQCRSYNKHNLKPLTIFYWGPEGEHYCRVSECSSCGARKEDYHYSDGKKMDTRMDYPDGYLVTGYGRIPTDVVMRILLGRHDIADPSTLPPRITKRLSNKALSAANNAKVTKRSGKSTRRKNPKKDVAKVRQVR